MLTCLHQQGPNLPNPVDGDGKFTAEVPEFQGRFVKDADKEIIAALKVCIVISFVFYDWYSA